MISASGRTRGIVSSSSSRGELYGWPARQELGEADNAVLYASSTGIMSVNTGVRIVKF